MDSHFEICKKLHLTVIINSLMFLQVNLKWALDDSKGNTYVKIVEMSMCKKISIFDTDK